MGTKKDAQRAPRCVGDVMTSHVQTVTSGEALARVLGSFREGGFHHLPVVDDGQLVGIVSARDLVRLAQERGAAKLDDAVLQGGSAGDVMTPVPETIDPGASVAYAIERIGRGDLHALPVVDDDGALVGIVTHNDLLDYLLL